MSLQEIIRNNQSHLEWLLGIMLYRFLSENIERWIDEREEREDSEIFRPYNSWEDKEVEPYKEQICTELEYFISPSNLFPNVMHKISQTCFSGEKYSILKNALNETFKPYKQSRWGYDFSEILKIIGFEKNKSGLSEQQKVKKIMDLFVHVAEMDFNDSNNVKKYFEDVIRTEVQRIDEEVNGGEQNPVSLSDEMMTFLFSLALQTRDPNEIDSIYDPDCNWGYFLLKFREWLKSPQLKVFGSENNETMHALCLINLLIHGLSRDEFQIKQIPNFHTNLIEYGSDILQREAEQRYDAIFGNFLPLSDSRKKNNVSQFIDHCSFHLNSENGTAVILYFENAMTIHHLKTKKIIEDLAHYQCIDCVISFQDETKLCAEKVTKSLCVLVLKSRDNSSNRNLLMINVPKNYPTKQEEISHVCSTEEFQELYNSVIHRDPISLNKYKHVFLTYEQLQDKDFSLSIRQYIRFENPETRNKKIELNMQKMQQELKEVNAKVESLNPVIDHKLLALFHNDEHSHQDEAIIKKDWKRWFKRDN